MSEDRLRIDFVRNVDAHETWVEIYNRQGTLVYHELTLSEFRNWISKYGFNVDVDDMSGEVERCEHLFMRDWYDAQEACLPDYLRV